MSAAVGRRLFNQIHKCSVVNFRLCSSYFKAACLQEYGKSLEISKFKRLPLKPNEVRVNVKYCSLNYNDVKYLEKRDDREKKLPYVPGYELSGEVIEVGGECDYDEGDRVVGLLKDGNGGLAQEAVIRCENLWKLHPEIPYHHAAALISAHSTALLAFTHYYQLQEGNTVLVMAGPGGYGLAAVDVASSIFKAKVIALSDTATKATLLRDRGAFAAFQNNIKANYKEIMKATNNKGVDLIYDAVGGPIIDTLVTCLKDPENGVILGTYRIRNRIDQPGNEDEEKKDQEKPSAPTQQVLDKFKTVNMFAYQHCDQEEYYNLIQQTLDYYEDELLTAHISKTFELQDINQAIQYIKGKNCSGKVLIEIKEDD